MLQSSKGNVLVMFSIDGSGGGCVYSNLDKFDRYDFACDGFFRLAIYISGSAGNVQYAKYICTTDRVLIYFRVAFRGRQNYLSMGVNFYSKCKASIAP